MKLQLQKEKCLRAHVLPRVKTPVQIFLRTILLIILLGFLQKTYGKVLGQTLNLKVFENITFIDLLRGKISLAGNFLGCNPDIPLIAL